MVFAVKKTLKSIKMPKNIKVRRRSSVRAAFTVENNLKKKCKWYLFNSTKHFYWKQKIIKIIKQKNTYSVPIKFILLCKIATKN